MYSDLEKPRVSPAHRVFELEQRLELLVGEGVPENRVFGLEPRGADGAMHGQNRGVALQDPKPVYFCGVGRTDPTGELRWVRLQFAQDAPFGNHVADRPHEALLPIGAGGEEKCTEGAAAREGGFEGAEEQESCFRRGVSGAEVEEAADEGEVEERRGVRGLGEGWEDLVRVEFGDVGEVWGRGEKDELVEELEEERELRLGGGEGDWLRDP
ncbi:hypothetical protein HPP92_009531 [Vanilla planifolia]|uniref:Uncharacterized protein n=1 Tax=Vanilla planifolia TaxID=51239 RepID=A0A835V4U0_VANPL|nr:hypothetical protein HPP92_009531 [Vanilla planifolia]